MRWALALIAVLGLAAVPAAMAAKVKNGPTKGQVAKAGANVKFDKSNAVTHHHSNGKAVTFVPADVGHLNSEEMAKGAIIGKLETERATKDGLEPGVYRVYIRKPGGRWEIFYCQDDAPVAEASDVEQNLDNEHKPRFADGGNSIRYYKIKFSL
jgi:hypothetical protein